MSIAAAPDTTSRNPAANGDFASRWLPGLLIAFVLISLRPFESGAEPGKAGLNQGGDALNQIGFGLTGLLCLALWTSGRLRGRLGAFAHPLWLALPLLIGWGVVNADAPSSAFRASIFSAIVVAIGLSVMMLPRNAQDFTRTLAVGCGATLAMCFIAVLLVPEQGVHGSGGFESQHAGLWRGIFDHKNVASYVVAGFAFIGLYLARRGSAVGFAIALLAAIFTVKAGSKTVLAIAPLALGCAVTARWISWGPLRLVVLLTPLIILNIVTLGAVIHPPLLESLREVVPGLSYTGRTDLWAFGLDHLARVPWTGFGYESFWSTPRVVLMEQPIELSWDVRGIVHGHNAWLDAAIGFGVPGVVFLVLLLVMLPLADYLRAPRSGPAGSLATLCIAIWLLCALGASLESFFLRRADPVWFLMLIAVAGLRLLAHGSGTQRR